MRKIIAIVCILFLACSFVIAQDKPYNEEFYGDVLLGYEDCPEKKDREYLPRKMFCELPDIPSNFGWWKTQVEYWYIDDMDKIPSEVWMQPEFEKTWINNLGLIQYPPTNRFGGWGYSSYPADAIATMSRGEIKKFSNFLRTSNYINRYQGIELIVAIPEIVNVPPGNDIGGKKVVVQDPEIVKKYITLDIKDPIFVLEPSFPRYMAGYVKKVDMEVKVSRFTPPGVYVVGYNIGKPSADMSEEWKFKYMSLYEEGGKTVYDRPTYQVFIEVPEEVIQDRPYGFFEWSIVSIAGLLLLVGIYFGYKKLKNG